MRVLTAAAMREVDRRAIEELGVPSLVLMENAALGVVEALAERFPRAERVAIVCGPGNNGGDGLAIARHLACRGYEPIVRLHDFGRPLTADAAVQLAVVEKMGIALERAGGEAGIRETVAVVAACDLLVDALFGTGLSRPLAGEAATLVDALDALRVPRLAVDLPSGLDGDRGDRVGPTLRADVTVALAAPKVAHVLAPAARLVGELAVAELGIPGWLIDEAPGGLGLLLGDELAGWLPVREPDSHKGTFGHLLIVAGSSGKAGAAILAARAAVRGGAGLVTVACPAPIAPQVDLGSLESMTLALPSTESGGLALAGLEALVSAAQERTAVALGPGLGDDPETREVVRRTVLAVDRPLVLDADGLNAWAGRAGDLADRPAPTLLTPHPGELARLLDCSTAEIVADRIAAARRAVELTRAVVVLKGHQTVVATPEGEQHLNTTGNPGMASGGSGDVLTGLAGALLAQGLEAATAADLAVHLHGLAGDLAAAELGGVAVPASELVERLPAAMARLATLG